MECERPVGYVIFTHCRSLAICAMASHNRIYSCPVSNVGKVRVADNSPRFQISVEIFEQLDELVGIASTWPPGRQRIRGFGAHQGWIFD